MQNIHIYVKHKIENMEQVTTTEEKKVANKKFEKEIFTIPWENTMRYLIIFKEGI